MTSVPPSKRRAFTLVELLAVIAIIGVMIAVLVPSFAGMMRGQKVKTAVSQLKTTMSLTRQWAITKRETTYMVFPNDNASLYGGSNTGQVDKAFRAYNIYGQKSGYIRDWTYLPDGVVFVPSQGVYGNTDPRDTKNIFTLGATNSLPFPSNGSGPGQLVTVMFKPDGTVVVGNGSGGRFEVYLSEGWLENLGTPITLGWRPIAQRQLISVELFELTGQFRIRDYSDT